MTAPGPGAQSSLYGPPLSLPFPRHIQDGSPPRRKAPRSVSVYVEESCLSHAKLSCGKGMSLYDMKSLRLGALPNLP